MKDLVEMKLIQKFMLWNMVALLFLAGCSSKPKKTPPSPPATLSSATPPIQESTGPTEEELRQQRLAEQMREAFKPVYFNHDQATLDNGARAQLAGTGAFMKEHSGISVVIEGYCDEQGTDEYNLALGEKRAAMVLKYLSSYGIAPGRIKSVSFGEENPAQQGHDEASWRLNRRVEFRVSP